MGMAPAARPTSGRPYDRGDRAAAALLGVLGAYGLVVWARAVAPLLPGLGAPSGESRVDALLGLALMTPPSIVGALALIPAVGVGRARPWGRSAGIAWATIVAAFWGWGLLRLWGPAVGSLASGSWINVALSAYWVPLPFVAGGIAAILLLWRPPRRLAALAVIVLLAAIFAGALLAAGALLEPSPTPAPTT